jgi:hypothetical protein
MEPIFARLGVKHQSRNFGNGGLGTQHNAFAGGSIWGPDVDMLMWDSGMTEGGNRDPDLMMRQGMIGGMKVPVLWNFNHPTMITYHEKADVDIILNGAFSSSRLGVPQQDTLEDIDKTVWASKFLKCGQELKGHCRANEYNGTCWVERPDLPPPSTQKKEPGGRAAWHPGNRIHQILGRTLAMTILFALHDALTMWSESGSEADAYKLEDHVWHVTEYYENQRTKVQLVDPMETGCGAFEKEHGIGWVCKVPFKVSYIIITVYRIVSIQAIQTLRCVYSIDLQANNICISFVFQQKRDEPSLPLEPMRTSRACAPSCQRQ